MLGEDPWRTWDESPSSRQPPGGGGWQPGHFLLRDGSDAAVIERALKAEIMVQTAQVGNPHRPLNNKLGYDSQPCAQLQPQGGRRRRKILHSCPRMGSEDLRDSRLLCPRRCLLHA